MRHTRENYKDSLKRLGALGFEVSTYSQFARDARDKNTVWTMDQFWLDPEGHNLRLLEKGNFGKEFFGLAGEIIKRYYVIPLQGLEGVEVRVWSFQREA